ncbi:MAG TPA: hypothetical protein VGJ13_10005 [Pseudonocardiaceae bacterium]
MTRGNGQHRGIAGRAQSPAKDGAALKRDDEVPVPSLDTLKDQIRESLDASDYPKGLQGIGIRRDDPLPDQSPDGRLQWDHGTAGAGSAHQPTAIAALTVAAA